MGALRRFWNRIRSAIISINAVRLVLEWFGWKQLVFAFLLSAGG
jgi:hypothetical protein